MKQITEFFNERRDAANEDMKELISDKITEVVNEKGFSMGEIIGTAINGIVAYSERMITDYHNWLVENDMLKSK